MHFLKKRKWKSEQINFETSVYPQIKIDKKNKKHGAYLEKSFSGCTIQYIFLNKGKWTIRKSFDFETEKCPYESDIKFELNSKDAPRIVYVSNNLNDANELNEITLLEKEGKKWKKRKLAEGNLSEGYLNFKIDSNDNLHLVYLLDGIRYIFVKDNKIKTTTIEKIGNFSNVTRPSLSFALSKNGRPYIVYSFYSEDGEKIYFKLALYKQKKWKKSTIGVSSEISERGIPLDKFFAPYLALRNEKPYIAHFSFASNDDQNTLYLLRKSGNLWKRYSLVQKDPSANLGEYSFVFDSKGKIHLIYRERDVNFEEQIKYLHTKLSVLKQK
jgi:hypothetical protein